MKSVWRIAAMAVLVSLLLGGCSMRTVEQMYCLPKRSEEYNDLQAAIDGAMKGLSYCAPLSGEHRQPVQSMDLNGDGMDEYLLFVKGTGEKPLKILLFEKIDGTYCQTETISGTGTAFDQVEYITFDDRPGAEIVVGSQVSEQVLRSLAVYSFSDSGFQQIVSVNYSRFLSVDLDENDKEELFVIRPGNTETDPGVVELYDAADGTLHRSNEVNMSCPADALKRITVGNLYGGTKAVFLANAVGDSALITDVYCVRNGMLTNVVQSGDSDTGVQTLRNYYVYADDIDADGTVEIPALMSMKPIYPDAKDEKHRLIRWYAMTPSGGEIDKLFTFHCFEGGWYFRLDGDLASRLTVSVSGNRYIFYAWDTRSGGANKLFTLTARTNQGKAMKNEFIVMETDSMIYTASLETAASQYGITQESVENNFRLIRQAWKTGET